MTEKDTLIWIKDNLSVDIKKAIADANNVMYTEDWIAAMCYRETGILIVRYAPKKLPLSDMAALMKGDYGQRKGETEKQYHGFGYMQIDIASYPDYVKSGDWKVAYKVFKKAISVLEEKRKYIVSKLPNLTGIALEDAITAAYNTGQGNVVKSITAGKSPDNTTFNKDYAKEVRRFRTIYNSL